MRAVSAALPCYAGDVSGACSALFELGGMVLVHDPSGCNSTYNTHDETRWYDHDSLIYISGLSERDAILGNDKKLVDEVVEAVRALKPAFVALAGSPVPFLTGTDLPALAHSISGRCGIETFCVPTNGMHDYVRGAGMAFAELARRFVRPCGSRRGRAVNVLGATPLDFMAPGCMGSLKAVLEGDGWELVSCWAMGSELEELARAAEASVNLVVSATGLAAARVLRERFGTPYVAGLPVPGFCETVLRSLEHADATGENEVVYLRFIDQDATRFACAGRSAQDVALVGEPVCMGSLAAAFAHESDVSVRLVCPVEADRSLLGPAIRVKGESQLRRALAGASRVVADPLYAPALPAGAALCSLPQLAFSGRCCLSSAVDPMTLDVRSVLGPEA